MLCLRTLLPGSLVLILFCGCGKTQNETRKQQIEESQKLFSLLRDVNSKEDAERHRAAILESRKILDTLRKKRILSGQAESESEAKFDSQHQSEINKIKLELSTLTTKDLHQYGFQPDLHGAIIDFLGTNALKEIVRKDLELQK